MGKTTGNVSLILCLVCTILLIDCARSRAQESTGQYIDDTVITENVKSKLSADPGLEGLAIKVETSEGVVLLNGLVDTREQVQRAVEIARGVEGVKKVKQSLILKGIY